MKIIPKTPNHLELVDMLYNLSTKDFKELTFQLYYKSKWSIEAFLINLNDRRKTEIFSEIIKLKQKHDNTE